MTRVNVTKEELLKVYKRDMVGMDWEFIPDEIEIEAAPVEDIESDHESDRQRYFLNLPELPKIERWKYDEGITWQDSISDKLNQLISAYEKIRSILNKK